ncbi:hypothetical protein PV328_001974 [Microctonus aethiopoides]|uniref:Uncharacterized protein n=1 Tax=Microctonus aethiopoides TaxID=144406 RepID=A0AA39KY34_9HYME|nr:hypothetical protein PV328_001974 [Microctonus aethiopoides]
MMFRGASVIVLIIALGAVGFAEEIKYPDKYDYIDVDAILSNARQRETYYKCFSGTSPCITADAKFFRDRFPEAIVTNCKKCTAKQSENFDKITDWYTAHEPEKYNALVEMALRKLTKKS